MRRFGLSIPLFLILPSALVAQLSFRDTDFRAVMDTARTADVDLSTFPGNIILLTGTNTNLALNRPVVVRYTDPTRISSHPTASNPNRVASNSFFELLPGQEGSYLRIDLQAIRVVNRVVMRTFPNNSPNFRVRGYSIYVGLDTLTLKKVKQVAENELATTNDFFDPDTARYVQIVIDRQDPSLTNPFSTTFGEIEVYGIGYLSQGRFTSRVRDAQQPVNWGTAGWRAVTPPGTLVTMQFRTGDVPTVNSTWSEWSPEIYQPDSLFDVFEPRRYLQYRINLYTFSTETPRVEEAIVRYDTLLVMQNAQASLNPQVTQILKDVQVRYDVNFETSARSTGVDTLVIFTDLPLTVTNVTVGGQAVGHRVDYRSGRIVIGLTTTLNTSTTMSVFLRFTPFLLENRFPSMILSNANPTNPQRVNATVSAGTESWTLLTTGVPEQIIVEAQADPNPFTPNGDGLNDQTAISFFVSNLVEPRPVKITIYDVTGRVVRTLLDVPSAAAAFVERNAILWDGRDDDGRLLPPGLYLYQIVVDVDGLNPAVVTKTIGLAY
jgi:hypothetical protein